MANLTRWDPFREMLAMRDLMDRVFDRSLTAPSFVDEWGLALDVIENSDEYVVKASVPGINPDDIDITYDNRTLTIKGEIREETDQEEGHYHLRERRYGSFARSLTLPTSIDADKINANYEAGVLSLHLPKVEEAKPKRIAVQSAEKVLQG
jgi:HSP20 family protein